MFLLSNKYNMSIINDFSNLVNVKNFKMLNLVLGDISKLSFLNGKIKKQHKKKLVNLLIVELVGLQKSFLKINIKRGKKKIIFIPSRSVTWLNNKIEKYYLYTFSKINIGSMHTILKYGLIVDSKDKQLSLKTAFDIIFENSNYFTNLLELNFNRNAQYSDAQNKKDPKSLNSNTGQKKDYFSLGYLSFFKKSL